MSTFRKREIGWKSTQRPAPYIPEHGGQQEKAALNILRFVTRVRISARYQNCEKLLFASSCPTFRPSSWNKLAPNGRILINVYIFTFFRKSVE
jgi:hypothetical protein